MPHVVFTTSTSWLSRAIRWVTGGEVSHVGLVLDFFSTPVVLHASVGGVEIDKLSTFLKSRTVVAVYRSQTSLLPELSRAVQHIDEQYDYVGLLGYLVSEVFRRVGMFVRNPLARPDALVCSEFLALAFGLKAPENVTPQDLYDFIRVWPKFVEVTSWPYSMRGR